MILRKSLFFLHIPSKIPVFQYFFTIPFITDSPGFQNCLIFLLKSCRANRDATTTLAIVTGRRQETSTSPTPHRCPAPRWSHKPKSRTLPWTLWSRPIPGTNPFSMRLTIYIAAVNMIAQAQSGTGKTPAFTLAMLSIHFILLCKLANFYALSGGQNLYHNLEQIWLLWVKMK